MSDPPKVFITGATGLIGRALAAALVERGDAVIALTRDTAKGTAALPAGVAIAEGDPTEAGDWQQRIDGCDVVVNLAGESIGGTRWNAMVRQRLLDSRVDGTRFVVEAIGAAARKPGVLVSASGADYYPFGLLLPGETEEDDAFDETAPNGDGFLPRLCRDWEAEAVRAEEHGVRVARMRTGLVLDDSGGALPAMARPFKLFAGGKVGDGKQWVSWLDLDDAVGGYLHAIDHASVTGPVNLVAGSLRQHDFARALGRALHRPCWLPAPKFAIRWAVGPLSEYLLHGRNVVPAALRDTGYAFRYADIDAALGAIYG